MRMTPFALLPNPSIFWGGQPFTKDHKVLPKYSGYYFAWDFLPRKRDIDYRIQERIFRLEQKVESVVWETSRDRAGNDTAKTSWWCCEMRGRTLPWSI